MSSVSIVDPSQPHDVTVSFPPASSSEADIAGLIQAAVTAGRSFAIRLSGRVLHSECIVSACRKAGVSVSVVLDKEGEPAWAAGGVWLRNGSGVSLSWCPV